MKTFPIDPRDGNGGGSCSTCCCQPVNGSAGETDKWVLEYAAWTIPLRGRGLTINSTFLIEDKTPSAAPGGNLRPSVPFVTKSTQFNTEIVINLATEGVTDPEGDPLKFKLLALYGPTYGDIELTESGMATYTPRNGYYGPDTFFYTVTDGNGRPIAGEVAIAVQPPIQVPPLPAVPLRNAATPKVMVQCGAATINTAMQTLSFPVSIAPTAMVGDLFRLTVRQQAIDCDCGEYWHTSCYDIAITKC